MLVELVMTAHGRVNAKMLEEDTAGTRVLGKDDIHSLEHLDGTHRHVSEVPDGSWHYV